MTIFLPQRDLDWRYRLSLLRKREDVIAAFAADALERRRERRREWERADRAANPERHYRKAKTYRTRHADSEAARSKRWSAAHRGSGKHPDTASHSD